MSLVRPDMIGWGSYSSYEGPYFKGRWKFELPQNPDMWDKILHVCVQTEGGCFDSVNAYDSCILSISALQLCDRFMLSTRLLGAVADKLGQESVTGPLFDALKSSNATFKKIDKFGWKFVFLDERGVVNSTNLQRELYFKGTGLKNSWTNAQKAHAKLWVAGIANVWNDERARKIQYDFLKSRILMFVLPETKKKLFDVNGQEPWISVARSAFTSFSANIPLVATKMFNQHSEKTRSSFGSKEWTIELIAELTWGPEIGIYAGRYDKIRPILEKCFGVELPKNAQALKSFRVNSKKEVEILPSHPPVDPTSGELKTTSLDNPEIVENDVVVPIRDEIVPPPVVKSTSIIDVLIQIIAFIAALFSKKNT